MKSPSTPRINRPFGCTRFAVGVAVSALALSLFIPVSSYGFEDYPGYVIRSISITPKEVFDTATPEENTWLGRGANRVHIITKPEVIRGELLFKEGDPYDKTLIEESIRLLRSHSYLTDIKIIVAPDLGARAVDITVETRDQWSLLIGTTTGGTSDNSVAGLDVGDKNFLGSGNSLGYSIRHDNSGYSHNLSFTGSNILYSRYDLFLGYEQVQYERSFQSSLERPFYSIATEAAHGVAYTRKEHNEPGLQWVSYRLNAYAGRAEEFDDIVLRTSIRLSLGEEIVSQGSSGLESLRDNKVLADIQLLDHPRDYTEETYVEKYRRVEDIPLGPRYSILIGPRLASLGSSSSDVSITVGVNKWHKIHGNDLLFGSVTYSKNDDAFNDKSGDFSLRYYLRQMEYQTFVFRGQITYMESATNRFHLGGNNGLRGYKTDEFTGVNHILMNFEDRIYTKMSMFSGIVEPGFVLFFDAGNTWNNYGGDNLTRLWTSVGAGLRLALLKAPGISLIRLDYGIPTDFNRGGVLTVGMEGFF